MTSPPPATGKEALNPFIVEGDSYIDALKHGRTCPHRRMGPVCRLPVPRGYARRIHRETTRRYF